MREARSYAVLGDVERFQRALAKAHREFDLGDDNRGNDPAWISFYDPAELLGLEGTCWADVGQYHRAVPLLEQALSRQAPTYQRNRALYQGRLAVARLGHGDPIHAVANATTVTLQLLESGLGSARTAELVRTVRRQVTPYRQEPAVREFATRYDQYATA
ncbi:MAG: hypothetical protein ACJ73S_03895 [Mycobacteriales bacterium]